MNFQKQDLAGTDYNWMDNDNCVFVGQPSRRIFDRFNGNQVLFLINSYGSSLERFTVVEAKGIEQRILRELPLEVKSEISVFNWIRKLPATGR